MKKICLLLCMVLVAVSCVALLEGCNGTQSDPNTITVWWPSGKTMQDIIQAAVKDFTATHPDAKIKIVNKPVDAFEAYKYALNDNKIRPDIADTCRLLYIELCRTVERLPVANGGNKRQRIVYHTVEVEGIQHLLQRVCR